MVVGNEMTIIGCVGDTSKVDPRLFEVDPSVERVMHVQEPYKLANRAFHPENSIIDVSGVKIGGDHLGLIAGPCSVETYEQVLGVAKAAKASGANLLEAALKVSYEVIFIPGTWAGRSGDSGSCQGGWTSNRK